MDIFLAKTNFLTLKSNSFYFFCQLFVVMVLVFVYRNVNETALRMWSSFTITRIGTHTYAVVSCVCASQEDNCILDGFYFGNCIFNVDISADKKDLFVK